MNKKLPYEELFGQQLSDLPLPDEEQSWQKMKKLLDDDKDNDRLLPPLFLRGCYGWSLLLIALLVAFWLIVHPEKWFKKDSISRTEEHSKDSAAILKKTVPHRINNIKRGDSSLSQKTLENSHVTPETNFTEKEKKQKDQDNTVKDKEKAQLRYTKSFVAKKQYAHKVQTPVQENKDPRLPDVQTVTKNEKNNIEKNNITFRPPNVDSSAQHKKIDSLALQKQDTVINKNKNADKQKDSLKKDSLVVVDLPQEKQKQKTKKPNPLYLTAGLGLQQQIPLSGQKLTPYNYYGRRGSLADYVPSVYLRLHEINWFFQGEFRFGAPQVVKDIAYRKESVTDTFGITTNTTLRAKKTFYHQLPLSFNYKLLSNWHMGAGIMYSIFYSAVVEKEVARSLTTSKELIPVHREDSAGYSGGSFKNSQIHLLFQTEYAWKKFSFGLRYTVGLQPFIRYLDTNGDLVEQKNHSLQFSVKYQLWRSKEF